MSRSVQVLAFHPALSISSFAFPPLAGCWNGIISHHGSEKMEEKSIAKRTRPQSLRRYEVWTSKAGQRKVEFV
jgi:hypothetical protein